MNRRGTPLALALTSALLLASTLTACGSSSNEAVATVAGYTPITKGLVAHWIPIEATLAYNVTPIEAVPAGVIPDPPQYKACMAFLKAHPTPAESAEHNETPAKLKQRCQAKEENFRNKVVRYMIAYRWLKGELARRHTPLTHSELYKPLRQFETYDKTPAEFRQYMLHSKETRADLLTIIEIIAMGEKLNQMTLFSKSLTLQQRTHELAELTRRWKAKTDCKVGYVVQGCRQYKGSESPL